MKTHIARLLLMVGALLAVSGPACADGYPPLGMNLTGVVDWSTEYVFVDAFKASRPWISQMEGKPWGQGGELPLTADGYPARLAPGQSAETLMFVDVGKDYPGGKYVCRYQGTGEITFGGAAKVTSTKAGRIEVDVQPERGQISLKITKTHPKDPIHRIRLVRAEFEMVESPFDPDFLKRYQGFRVLRFMDWQHTNNSKQVKWADRATLTSPTQASPKGVCLELCVDLANMLGIDPWFCVPHLADDEYVRGMANLIKDRLRRDRKVYIEYSNETWNGQFEQARYCSTKGKELGLSNNAYEAQLRYSAKRSVEIFRIFQEVFADKERLVRVLAAQSANPWTGTTVLDADEAYKSADAIAIAPYFGNSFGDPKTADKVANMSVDALLDGCAESIKNNRAPLEKYAAEAKKRNVRLIAYEGGQHLAGYGGAENNEKLTALFHAANRHPRMKDLYLQDYQQWKAIGGGEFCVFSSVGRYSKWGSWGALEQSNQPVETAPKWQAIQAALKGK